MNNKILGDKRKSNFDDNLANVVNEIFDNMPETPEVKTTSSNVRLERVSDGFIFYDLPSIGSVKLLEDYLGGGCSKTHDGWRAHCRIRNYEIVVPTSVVLYQIARVLYELRNDSNYQEVVKECIGVFHQDWTNIYAHTGTKVTYGGGLNAVVDHLQLDGSSKKISLEIPEFTKNNDDWSYLVLAPKQAEENLGNVTIIPDNAKPILQELLGEGYERAGEVFQYVSPRKKGNLREIRFWTPNLTKRNSEQAVVFGVYDVGSYNFGIDANGNINDDRPAHGVVAVQKNSSVILL